MTQERMIGGDWDTENECPRCGEVLTPGDVELRNSSRACPKCGRAEHPAFMALDGLCGDEETA